MCYDDEPSRADCDIHAAFALFLALHDSPTEVAAENLIEWLRGSPRHIHALDEALTLWAMSGIAG